MSAAVRARTGPSGRRRSPMDAVHEIAVRYARPDGAGPGHADGPVRRWCTGVASARGQVRAFADIWRENNQQALAASGPLWVVLGDSTAQGIGASSPLHGYVGQTHAEMVRRSDRPWRVVNLSRSGAVASDVLTRQLPRIDDLPIRPDLVTCGIGGNDILATPPRQLHRTLRALIAALPACAVVLDLPLPVGLYGGIGRMCTPYVARVNHTIHTTATARGIPVAEYSRHYTPPWAGKFAADLFHPSDLGYTDMARAVLAAIPPPPEQRRPRRRTTTDRDDVDRLGDLRQAAHVRWW